MTENEILRTTRQVADQLGVKPKTLANWRSMGIGPRWFRVGGRVMYRQAEIDRWLAECEASTGPDVEPRGTFPARRAGGDAA